MQVHAAVGTIALTPPAGAGILLEKRSNRPALHAFCIRSGTEMNAQVATILVVTHSRKAREALDGPLLEEGHYLIRCSDPEEALERLSSRQADCIVLEWDIGDEQARKILRESRERCPGIAAVAAIDSSEVEAAVDTVGEMVNAWVVKPAGPNLLRHAVARALEQRRLTRRLLALEAEFDERFRFDGIVGLSSPMRNALEIAERAARTDSPVLLTGEVGTGKRLFARAIHRHSSRREHPFVVIHTAGLPEELLIRELLVALSRAHHGTALIVDVDAAPPAAQSALVQLLEGGRLAYESASPPGPLDVRVICTSTGGLAEAAEAGLFRRDLYYRLNVLPIPLPPLRSRRSDIPLLATVFAEKFARRLGRETEGVDDKAMDILTTYSWPGNVRELESAIERAVILGRGKLIQPQDLPPEIRAEVTGLPVGMGIPEDGLKMDEVESGIIRAALEKTGGNQTQAAKLVGLTRKTFLYRMKKYGITPPRRGEPL